MMKHTEYFRAMMDEMQAINVLEKGISFTEGGFTQLYEQSKAAINIEEEHVYGLLDGYVDGVIDSLKDGYIEGVNRATVKGILIGSVGTGVGIGLIKVGKKIKKRKLEKSKEEV